MKKKEMIPLTTDKRKAHREQNACYVIKKEFITDNNNKKYF